MKDSNEGSEQISPAVGLGVYPSFTSILGFVHTWCPKFLFMLSTFNPYLSLGNFPQFKKKAAGRQVLYQFCVSFVSAA